MPALPGSWPPDARPLLNVTPLPEPERRSLDRLCVRQAIYQTRRFGNRRSGTIHGDGQAPLFETVSDGFPCEWRISFKTPYFSLQPAPDKGDQVVNRTLDSVFPRLDFQ